MKNVVLSCGIILISVGGVLNAKNFGMDEKPTHDSVEYVVAKRRSFTVVVEIKYFPSFLG